MSTFLFLDGSNGETTLVVYRWKSQGNCQTLGRIIALTGALNAEQTWYFRANWGCYFSCAQVQRILGLFCALRLQGHQRMLFASDLLQETAKNHLKHNPTWFIGSEIK